MKRVLICQLKSIFILLFFTQFFTLFRMSNKFLHKKRTASQKRNLDQVIYKRKRKIRIFIDDTYMKSQNNGKYSVVINALTNAANYWSKILKVERINFKLTKNMFDICLMQQYHPDLDESRGIEADLIIFPFFNTINPSTYMVLSDYCTVEDSSSKPIGGTIQINTNINTSKKHSDLFSTYLFIHEMAHIFGFLYKRFEPFIITRTINGRSKNLLASPKVIQAAKRHFCCRDLEGVELEDDGDEYSKNQH